MKESAKDKAASQRSGAESHLTLNNPVSIVQSWPKWKQEVAEQARPERPSEE